jgi:hypothetical protein
VTTYRIGEPCPHPDCLSHISHPCEGCGRIAGWPSEYMGLSLGTAYELQQKDLVPIAREDLASFSALENHLRFLLLEIEKLSEYPETPWETKIYDICINERHTQEAKPKPDQAAPEVTQPWVEPTYHTDISKYVDWLPEHDHVQYGAFNPCPESQP